MIHAFSFSSLLFFSLVFLLLSTAYATTIDLTKHTKDAMGLFLLDYGERCY